MSFPRRWWGKLFHSLMILTRKGCLKADFMCIFNELWDLVLLLLNSTQNSHGILAHLTQILSYSTLLDKCFFQVFTPEYLCPGEEKSFTEQSGS